MPANATIELFSARVCPYAHRTRLVLAEKGLDFELTEIDFKHKPERFLEISRYGKVPAIVHNGNEIYDLTESDRTFFMKLSYAWLR